ncbi:YhgE/Pip domain-containing protein [bacterium D16-51]|nr:YhgE/Pip domain-containing protein [bacterium D16-59]RKI60737.1 YhgE/Pip domain-containing protein [bacterium D16-51]
MDMIKKIFISDIKALTHNFYVLIITIGLCFLPALYAWFNIYSNWDPYGSTNNIKIAAASNDSGYTDAEGNKTIAGDEILETLKKNKSIHWVNTTAEKAKNGVYSGEYYAAVVLPENFSECMYNGFLQGLKRPEVTYYENEKKNSVATKITDTAVSTLQNNINQMYISVLVNKVFERENAVAAEIQEGNMLSTLQEKVTGVSKNLKGYSKTIDALASANKKLSSSIDSAIDKLGQSPQTVRQKASERQSQTSVSSLAYSLRDKTSNISTALSSVSSYLNRMQEAVDFSVKSSYYQKALAQLDKAAQPIDELINALSRLPADSALQSKAAELRNELQQLKSYLNTLEKQLENGSRKIDTIKDKASSKAKAAISALEEKALQTASLLENAFQNVIRPLAEEIVQLTNTVQNDISNAAESIVEDINLLKQLLTGTKSGLASTDQSLSALSDLLGQASGELAEINTTIASLTESEFLHKVLAFMQGNPEGYGKFFASPIAIKTEQIYPVENYGSGVTPFYTTLALWVGGIFLVSMIKVNPDAKKFPGARPHELFCGRFLLFLLLGQVQTLIIVLGNIGLLHTQCLHPRHFWFACAVTSFTFLLFIYAFTVSFGDIGKALIVVFVVIQIAGSSGTYPIEILPEFYQKIHIFFPFPYAINAMREAICGLNGNDYFIYLAQLLVFAIAALMLGLVIRLPFRNLNHFVEKRMEDSELL